MISDEKYIYIGENGDEGKIFILDTETLETLKVLKIKFSGLGEHFVGKTKEIKMSANQTFLVALVSFYAPYRYLFYKNV